MTKKVLYVYKIGQETVWSPEQIDGYAPVSTMTRLIADDGMRLYNGDQQRSCIDVEDPHVSDWTEKPRVKAGE